MFFSNRDLSTIAMLAALHFAVSYVSRLAAIMLFAILGPLSVFPAGFGNELLPSLLLAVAVALVPRVGTAALSIAVVWLLNGIVTGSVTAASSVQVLVSLITYDLLLGALGVTLESPLNRPAGVLSKSLVARTALALGLANCAALYVQFYVSIEFYSFEFASWYIHAVALLTGLVYGAAGAAIGTVWAFQLRKAAP